MAKRSGHVAFWPPQWTQERRERTLGYCETDTSSPVRTEHGELLSVPVQEPAAFAKTLTDERIDLYTDHFTPWLAFFPTSMIDVAATSRGEIIGIRVRHKRRTAWIGHLRYWSLPDDLTSLATLRELYRVMDVGTYSTPGSLGDALLRELWSDRPMPRPPQFFRETLISEGIGGRAESPADTKREYKLLYELDLSSAYVRAMAQLPAGVAIIDLRPDRRQRYSTYYAECLVTLKEHVPLGPFAIRPKAHGKLEYPSAPGVYGPLWLWAEEVAAIREIGGTVDVGAGRGWRRMSDGAVPWIERMLALRAENDGPIADLLKIASVATIGRHGAHPTRFALELADDAKAGDMPILENGMLTNWVLTTSEAPNLARLTHWHYYVAMIVRLQIWRQALFEHARNNAPLAINFDAVYCEHPPEPLYPSTIKELTRVTFPYSRAIVSEQTTRLPGVPLTAR